MVDFCCIIRLATDYSYELVIKDFDILMDPLS